MRYLVGILTCSLVGGGLFASDRHDLIPVLFFANQQRTQGVRYLAKSPGIDAEFSDHRVEFLVGRERISVEFPGGRADVGVETDGPLRARANFLLGDSPARWQQNVELFERVIYRGLYDGIDMSYGGTGSLLKSEFVLQPRADAGSIRLKYRGARSLSVDKDGSLVFELERGKLREAPPIVYQQIDGERVAVAASYRLIGDGVVAFRLGDYDAARTLVIDPAISYSTYLGGSGIDAATSVAMDAAGSAYVAGYTESSDFPVAAGFQGANGGSVDAFVAKFSVDGKSLVYATLIGGSGDDRAFGIAVDSNGNAMVTGWTSSTNFPLANAFQGTNGGGRDAFVLKLNTAGSALAYSTLLGGSGADSGNAIATDASGNAYVAGDTTSTNFPVRSAYQLVNKGRQEAFVAKISGAGAVQFATYLGGAGDDRGLAIAVDSGNAVYVSGGTTSPDFPMVSAFQSTNGGGQDAFVTKLAANGATLTYSTYLGGSCGGPGQPEQANGIAVDGTGSAYVTGVTCSMNFPLASPLQTGHGGGLLDAFVTKFTPTGSALVYSTYLGGLGLDTGTAIAVDGSGDAFITGNTASSTFPLVAAVQSTKAGPYDAFVVKINPSGSAMALSTYLGGTGSDGGMAVKVDSSGGVWVVGQTTSTDFPLVTPFQSFGLTEGNGFLTKLSVSGTPSSAVTPSTGNGINQTFQFVFTDPAGVSDIQAAVVVINSSLNGNNACYFYVDTSGVLKLASDSTSSWTNLTFGSGTVQNSQCSISGTGASLLSSGTRWTLTLPISFQATFVGPRSLYALISDRAGQSPGWQQVGTWTVPGVAVAPSGTVAPATGSAATQVFQFTITDSNGASDIGNAVIVINSGLNGNNACYINYDASKNGIFLASNDTSSWTQLPASGAVQNSQCSITAQGSSITTTNATTIVVALALSFPASFFGSRTVFMQTSSKGSITTGWQQVGTWNVPGGVAPAESLSPVSGSGSTTVLSFALSDGNGAADVASLVVVVNAGLNGNGACYLYYDSGGQVHLASDDTSAWFNLTIGGSGIVQNSQCTISAAGSSVSTVGNTVTLNLAITFNKITFSGAKAVFMMATDKESNSTGWQQKGTWTVQ